METDGGGEVLGLSRGRVRLEDTEAGWPAAFGRLAAALRDALGSEAVAIEHVGSTAVPGLVSKPILDLAVALRRGADIESVIGAFERAGYQFRGDQGDEGGLLFVLEDQPDHRIAHVHVLQYADAQWSAYLTVRERLRADRQTRAAYEALKRRLAEEFPHDREAYTAGKASFIAGLLDDD